ncbi:MAG: hypothetical protein HY892_18225 [Deltaproteobacteria bacterium]|nr:hypothetical protein [Deltaproteobacteria bacterium]
MKKILIFAVVLMLAVVVAVPAFAFRIEGAKDTKFYLGGVALTDIGIWHMDKEVAQRSGLPNYNTSADQFILTVPRHSRLRTSVQSGNIGAYWELGMGRDLRAGHEEGDAGNTLAGQRTNYMETRKIYGWYTFGNCTLMAGKNDGSFWVAFPYQNLGFENNNHVIGLGWGSVYDDRAAQIRFTQNVSKTFSYQVSLVQPFYSDVTVGGVNFDTVAKYPRIDAMITLNFGPVSIMPGGTWSNLYWDQNPPGFDNQVNVWMAQLPVKVQAGAFSFIGQIGYGANIGFYPLQSAFWRPQFQNGKVKDTKGVFGFADFAFTAGAVTPHFYIGYDAPENTDVYVGEKKNERLMYGIGVNWKIADNFFVVPEFTMYDYGKNPQVAGNPSLGKEWLGGVQFQFVF